jgi:DNA-binding NtrC family response regulator
LAKTGLPVLITGETGTGKEVVAKLIHGESGRPGPFVAVNCAALPKELVTSELFGHTRGAFSGAAAARPGLFRAAEQGTLFFDEIGDMPLETQPSLLRALQESAIRPVGTEREIQVDVRVLAATHADLKQKVDDGTFRQDLYARLAKSVCVLPPLRERPLELLPLARKFAEEAGRTLNISAEAAEALLCGRFPLNIRELQSVIQLFCSTEPIDKPLEWDFLYEHKVDLFDDPLKGPNSRATTPVDANDIEAVLSAEGGNVSTVARKLGISRWMLYRKFKALGIDPESYRTKD